MKTKSFFPTMIYKDTLAPSARTPRLVLIKELRREISILQKIDVEGVAWSKANYHEGFTTYGSMDKLHQSSPTFHDLEKCIDRHVVKFVRAQEWDLASGSLAMSSCWVNVMARGAAHSMHLHPLSVVSGTFYVTLPRGSSAIKFEDPRLDRFMAQPPRRQNSKLQPFVTLEPREGEVVLFESWLRHEVPRIESHVKANRISVSFNYDWI